MAAWSAAGLESLRIPLVRAAEAAGTIIDIRQNAEFAAGHIPGAQHIELGSVVDADIREQGPLTLMCGHGERAMSAASLLEARGRRDLAVVVGGPADWAAGRGSPLETGR
jgi:rhodanese-related sulfurtransferase